MSLLLLSTKRRLGRGWPEINTTSWTKLLTSQNVSTFWVKVLSRPNSVSLPLSVLPWKPWIPFLSAQNNQLQPHPHKSSWLHTQAKIDSISALCTTVQHRIFHSKKRKPIIVDQHRWEKRVYHTRLSLENASSLHNSHAGVPSHKHWSTSRRRSLMVYGNPCVEPQEIGVLKWLLSHLHGC